MTEPLKNTSLSQRSGIITPDWKLIQQRIGEGDQEAFAVLFNHYYTLLRPFVWKFTQSNADSEEILQETFIRVWLSRDEIPSIDNLHAWIYTIAARRCKSLLRRRMLLDQRSELFRQETAGKVFETPAQRTELAEISERVAEAVSSMPAQRQRIYRMSRERGMKPAAIAADLGLSVSTVKNTLNTALKEIRIHLALTGHSISLLYLLQHFL